ncbi:MAG TPA: hypothetical protein PKL13_02865 [bacterium]|nr:hypothetical protein [bacterium]
MFDDFNQDDNLQPNINNDQGINKNNDSLDFLQQNADMNYQDKLKNNSFISNPPNSIAEDMFADADKNKINSQTLDTQNRSGNIGPAPMNPITDYSQFVSEAENFNSKKSKPIFFIIGLMVLLGIISTGGYWIYLNYFKNNDQIKEVNLNNDIGDINLNNNKEENQEDVNINESSVKEDTDGDGLKDEDEKILGTDINSPDTDGDGLFDREEVVVYSTDPLNIDTDGDGYKDGEEVDKGYNPLGPGRLLNIEMITPQNDEQSSVQDKKLLSTNIDLGLWRDYTDKTLNISFKYPPSWKLIKKNNVIFLSGLDGDIVSLDIRENRLELDLIDWITTQSDFPDFRHQEINVNNINALALSSIDSNWNAVQSIFIPGPKKVFCFNYLNKKINDGEFKEFQEIVLSFSYS